MYVHHVHVMPSEIRRGHHILWDWSCRWFRAAMWVPGTKLGSFVRAKTCWTISPAPVIVSLIEKTEQMLFQMKALALTYGLAEVTLKTAVGGRSFPLGSSCCLLANHVVAATSDGTPVINMLHAFWQMSTLCHPHHQPGYFLYSEVPVPYPSQHPPQVTTTLTSISL